MRPTRAEIGRLICLGGLLLLAPAALARHAATIPSGYYVDPSQADQARPADRVEADGDFTLSIHRTFENPLEARLLGIAESIYPPRERLIDRAIEQTTEIGSDSTRAPLWWCDGVGVSRVPYAVTAGAVKHYTDLTDRFRAHNFRGAWDHNLFWTEFRYEASIKLHDHYYMADSTASSVYVAEMSLAWSYDDGTFVPVSLAHRVVVLSRAGDVISVEGDGLTDEQVYQSSHRGIGRSESLMR
ncbi:MAG TPA: hypothetical protein VEU09_01225 [Candidatus Binatia bacterium]|nr:hypothetical protein [Candidatus Binatia bacterium]